MKAHLAALFLIAAAGCAIGPAYHRPVVETPAAWKNEQDPSLWKQAEPSDHAPRGMWWEIFGDAELNELMARTLAKNNDAQAALARVTQAKALARQATADWLPSANVTPAFDHFQRTRASFGGSGTFAGDTYSVPFDLSYEVDLWGRVRRSFEAASADAQAREAAYHSVLLSLTAETARLYLLARSLDSEIDILERTTGLRQESLDMASKRAEAGVVNELDVARAKTELAAAQAEAIDLHRRRAEIENALAVICGETASTFSLPPRPLTLDLPGVPAGLPSALLERRPDVAEAERAMAAANARIGVAKAAFFPTVSLTGAGGFESADVDALFDKDSRFWSIGPSISIPLFAGGRSKANLQATQASYDEAVAQYRQRVLTAFQEVEDALVNLRLRADQAEANARLLESARDSVRLSKARYDQGLVNYLEFVDAERSRLAAERTAVTLLSQRLVSTVLLIKAIGGGWDVSR